MMFYSVKLDFLVHIILRKSLYLKNIHFGLALVIHPPNTHLCEFTSGSIFKQTKKPKKQHPSVALSGCYGLLCTPMAVGLLDVNTP